MSSSRWPGSRHGAAARPRRRVLAGAYPEGAGGKGLARLLTTRLYPQRAEGALFAARAGRALIADEMGLGKTVQAIAAAELMARHLGVQGLRPARQRQYADEAFCGITTYETLARDLDRLGATLAPVMLRRRQSEVPAQLPERIDKTLFVPLTPPQRLLHDENGALVARTVARWRRTGFLSDSDQRRLQCALQNMRMACDSTWLLDRESDHGAKADEALAVLSELLEQPGAKAVVFSQWLGVLAFKKSLFAGVLDGGDAEVFLGGTRLARFMDSVDHVTGAIGRAEAPSEPVAEPAAASASVAPAHVPAPVAPSGVPPEPASAASAVPRDPWAPLLAAGLKLVEQLAAPDASSAWLQTDAAAGPRRHRGIRTRSTSSAPGARPAPCRRHIAPYRASRSRV